MKEMVGGCCVCSDERGWTENPLVYCDGQGCTVAVHQACYGIVTVPSGPWYCRKCESQENAARVRCELCPSRDGALKKTDNNQWAHVVCALYIPEVRFGNVTTMEPIILQLIPAERYNKTCYICEEEGKGTRSSIGACMQCNKSGCKQQFHVTCAQSLGLLCEEAGNYLDNVKYCGYCQHHYSKLKKGGNVKTIPPYKPVHPDTISSDSSPEKEVTDSNSKPGPVKRKNSAKSAPVTPAPLVKVAKPSSEAAIDTKELGGAKFTTSNFVESVVTNSESVFGAETLPGSRVVAPLGNKKRKSANRTPPLVSENEVTPPAPMLDTSASRIKSENVASDPEPPVIKIESNEKTNPVLPPPADDKPSPVVKGANVIASTLKSNVITSTGSVTSSIVVSVPISAATALHQTASVLSTPPTLFQQLKLSIVPNSSAPGVSAPPAPAVVVPPEVQPAKRRRSQSSEKPDKSRKNKRAAPAPAPAPCVTATKRNSRAQIETPPPRASPLPLPSAVQVKDSPPSSPASEAAYSAAQHRKNKKKTARERPDPKDTKIFSNGVSAPHMLGNQLNPSSNMSKKLTDALTAEMEAHSVFTDSNTASSLVGPQLHSRVIASVRSSTAAAAAANSAANPLSMGLGAAFSNSSGSIPQSLDQLLERQWEQGSQFLMEQAQHFDIASLLSCLHQLRAENLRLEEHVNNLLQRRDHLLAVNARLAIPLTTQPPAQVNNVHPEPPSRGQRVNNTYPQHSVENGLDGTLYPSPHRSPSGGPALQAAASRSSSADNRRISGQQQPSYAPSYQVGSNPAGQVLSAATSQAIHAQRRDAVTDLHAMSSSKHS